MYNILIVDDEKIERSGIRMLLKRMGIELGVFEACNGKQALEYLTSDKNTGMGHIDILLTDVKMPFMDGIELIKNVMHNDISLKTIIFSGYNEFEYAKLAVKLGVKDYILKPVDPSELEQACHHICSNRTYSPDCTFRFCLLSDEKHSYGQRLKEHQRGVGAVCCNSGWADRSV